MKPIIRISLLIVLSAFVLTAQIYTPYYGKNKVIDRTFDWKYLETAHFRIFHYIPDTAFIRQFAARAEASYEAISLFLNVKVEEKIPVIFYNSHIDFEHTNLFPGFLPAGVEAFAEPLAFRMVVHGDRSPDVLYRTFTHELGHIFEYQMIYKSLSGKMFDLNPPPDWVMEGFAEFITRDWESFSLMTVRDAVLNDQFPQMGDGNELTVSNASNRAPYDFGHVVMDFIYQKFGQNGVRNLFQAMRKTSVLARRRSILETFSYTPKVFNFELRQYLKERFKEFSGRENPEDYSFMIGPDFPYAYSFSHQVSPGGEMLAVATANFRRQKLDIVLISMKDGKVIRNITPGFSSRYDDISIQFDPASGSTFSWDPTGSRIAFFARKEFDNHLIVLNVLNRKIEKQIRLKEIQDPTNPVFHPQSGLIYFSGVQNGKSYLFGMDPDRGEPRRLTSGNVYIRSLAISPDGRQIAYSAKADEYYNLYLAPLDTPDNPIRLTSGRANDITPSFSRDGKRLYFSSDERSAFNLYTLDLAERTVQRHTDARSGNFFPLEVPGEPGMVVFSAYHKGEFQLFRKKLETVMASGPAAAFATASAEAPAAATAPAPAQTTTAAPAAENAAAPQAGTSTPSVNVNTSVAPTITAAPTPTTAPPPVPTKPLSDTPIQDYKPLKKIIVTALPPITIGYSSSGNVIGYTYLAASDLLADHNFMLYFSTQFGYRNFHFFYTNQKRRLQYFTHLFSEYSGYYIPSNGYYYFTLRNLIGAEGGVTYPFSRSLRMEATAAVYHQKERTDLEEDFPSYYRMFSGTVAPISLSLVGETTRFANYGPNMGNTFRLEVRRYLPISSKFLNATNVEADLRQYLRLDNHTLLAFRFNGFYSGGKHPQLYYTGGNNTIRSAEFLGLVGDRGFTFNAEFRFPLIHLAQTPLGLVGPLRGVFFFDTGAVWSKGQDFRFFEKGQGLKLKDGLASYGFGIQFFLGGLPLHFDWVYRTDFKSVHYKGMQFWIGFDF